MKGELHEIMRRFLSKYRKGSDHPEMEIDLSNVPLQTLQSIFGEPKNEPMYSVYTVESRHANALQPYISEPLDIRRLDYFLEAEQG